MSSFQGGASSMAASKVGNLEGGLLSYHSLIVVYFKESPVLSFGFVYLITPSVFLSGKSVMG